MTFKSILKIILITPWIFIKFLTKEIIELLQETYKEQVYVDGKRYWQHSLSKVIASLFTAIVVWGFILKYTGSQFVDNTTLGIASGLVSVIFGVLKWCKEIAEKNTPDNVSFHPNDVQDGGFIVTLKNTVSQIKQKINEEAK